MLTIIPTPYFDSDLDGTSGNIIYNSEAFYNKINNILTIKSGSIPFLRYLGLDIEMYLFRPLSPIWGNAISVAIISQINKYYSSAVVEVIQGDIDYTNRSYPMTILITMPGFTDPIIINKTYLNHV